MSWRNGIDLKIEGGAAPSYAKGSSARTHNPMMMSDLHREGALTESDKAKRVRRKDMVRRMRRRGGQSKALEFVKDIPDIRRGQVWSRWTMVKGQRVKKFYAVTRRRLTQGWLKAYTEYGVENHYRPREFFLKEGASPKLVREFARNECARQFVDKMADKRRNLI